MSPQRSRLLRKLSLAALSTLVALAVAWLLFGTTGPRFLRPSGADDTVVTLDLTEDVNELVRQRSDPAPDDVAPILRDGVPWPGLALRPETKAELIASFAEHHTGWTRTDPDAYFVRAPNAVRVSKMDEHPAQRWTVNTNSWGMRGAAEPMTAAPDLRIVVTGDSHVEGVCRDDETFPFVLGELLRDAHPSETVESLNAGVGGYGPYHYLGVLERVLALAPDVFVVTVFGGNDFQAAQSYRRFYLGEESPARDRSLLRRLIQSRIDMSGLRSQELTQALYYLEFPDQERRTVETMVALTDRMQSVCEEAGIELVAVYLPPALRGQPQHYTRLTESIESTLDEHEQPLSSSDRIADGWIEFLQERGIRTLDLRPVFRSTDERLYWQTDHHVNVAGHRLIARLLQPILDELLTSR